MKPSRVGVVALALLAAMTSTAPPTLAAEDSWSWPVNRSGLEGTFDPPETEYGSGHRGIDIRAEAGTPVVAVAPGRITFVGRIGAVAVVAVDHGDSRSTYQPVRSNLRVGDSVDRGDRLGTLLSGPSHCGSPCLHLGRLARDDTYLDPLDLLGGGRFRLISPNGPPPKPPAADFGSMTRPVDGPITSAFGMRVHPITGVRKLHDGTDFGAPCGTPVRAAAGGRVTSASSDGGYGKRVQIDHGSVTTGYAHLSSYSVARGKQVKAGEVIGRVGTTGLSTGCHLHFMATRGGRPIDPARAF